MNSTAPSPPQDLPEVMQQTVTQIGGGSPLVWLFEKTLTMSDALRQQGRIFISQTVKDYLTLAELQKHWVLKGDKTNLSNKEKKEYSVTVVVPDGKTSEIDFKIWGSLRTGDQPVGEGQPVLTGSNWNALVHKYNMVEGTKLQFWCFRKEDTNEFCFAINNKAMEGISSLKEEQLLFKVMSLPKWCEIPQDMSEVMQQTVAEIGGTTPVNWLFEKTLTMSDTLPQQGRIFIFHTVKDYLTLAELQKHRVLKGDKSNRSNKEKKEYSVTLVEPDGKTSEIDFKIWYCLGTGDRPLVGVGQPVLTGSNWNALVRKYNMVQGTKLQFWCFRKAYSNEFCFAIDNKE